MVSVCHWTALTLLYRFHWTFAQMWLISWLLFLFFFTVTRWPLFCMMFLSKVSEVSTKYVNICYHGNLVWVIILCDYFLNAIPRPDGFLAFNYLINSKFHLVLYLFIRTCVFVFYVDITIMFSRLKLYLYENLIFLLPYLNIRN